MGTKGDLLRQVMSETDTTQTMLSRFSGVRQPSISQFLSGKVEMSDEQLDRLLSCMGYRLEVVRRPVAPELTHSERRSWMLHRRLATHLTRETLAVWVPTIERNISRERRAVRGTGHVQSVDRWEGMVERRDVLALHRVMTGLDRGSIEMREVSPLGGLLPEMERLEVMGELREVYSAPRSA